jgi:hypothetical protein
LEIDLWQGKAKLENLSIRSEALEYHQLPFTVLRSKVGLLSLSLPWSSLLSHPCVVDIRNILLVGRSKPNGDFGSRKMSSMLGRITANINIQIDVSDFHLGSKFLTEISSLQLAMGFTFKSVSPASGDLCELFLWDLRAAVMQLTFRWIPMTFCWNPGGWPFGAELT